MELSDKEMTVEAGFARLHEVDSNIKVKN